MRPIRKVIAYYRVNTDKQRRCGLGLEAQRAAVRNHLNGGRWKLVDEFTENESGKRNDRPVLKQALAMCRLQNATLAVAKVDRLARNTHFLSTLVNLSGDAGVLFCDLPSFPEFSLTQMPSVAELEAALISERRKAALRAVKARRQVLGCRNDTGGRRFPQNYRDGNSQTANAVAADLTIS